MRLDNASELRALTQLAALAEIADTIAVAGENRFLNGRPVPTAAEVMHRMRDNIRMLLPEATS